MKRRRIRPLTEIAPWLFSLKQPEPETYIDEEGNTVKRYPAMHAEGAQSGPTAKPKERKKRKD